MIIFICKFIAIALLIPSSESVMCYSCGSTKDETDCNIFREALHWTPFSKECGDNTICTKTLSKDETEMRSCTPLRSVMGKQHEEGCSVDYEIGFTICFCKSDYCNRSSEREVANRVIWVLGFVIFIIGILI
ncbi:hypothetical protein Avbf_06545 [Armadillidium vulgare]|nr:hypothetical protein Avbf_06545 [Armadillidium vulgare]